MAGSSIIGALRVVLGADTTSLEDGLTKAQVQLKAFGSSVGKIAAGTAIGHLLTDSIEHVGHAFVEGLEHALKFADEMGKTAQKVGLPVEELSKLRVAAELSDVSMESLAKTLGILSKNMAAVASGDGAGAANTFRALGIEVKNSDGTLRSVSDVLGDLAGKFSESKDGATKTAAALNLMGRGGKDLIPLLNEGKDSLAELAKTAEHFGLVVSKDTAERAQKFNDNLKLVKLAGEGLANLVVAGLLPGMLNLSNGFIEAASKGDLIKDSAERIIGTIKALITVTYQAYVADQLLGQALQAVSRGFEAIGAFDFSEAGKQFLLAKTLVTSFGDKLDEARQTVNKFFNDAAEGAHKTKNEFDQDIAGKLIKAIEDTGFQTDILKGKFLGVAEGFPEKAKALGLDVDKIATSVSGLTGKWTELNQEQLKFNAQKLILDVTPWMAFEQQLARINLLYDQGKISAVQAGLATQKAAEQAGIAWDAAAVKITGDLASGLKAFAAQNKSLAGAAKASAIAAAVANTYLAATKALATYPPPLSYIAAAASVVAGLGYVAQIQAQSFARGGSFKVPGGISGVDNKLVSLNLAAGEMVNITPSDQVQSGGGGAVAEVTLRGRRLTDLLTLDDLRDLVGALNSANRDGYKLKFAV